MKIFRSNKDDENSSSEKFNLCGWSFLESHSSSLAWIILFTSILITVVAYIISNEWVHEASKTRFDYKTEDIHSAIQTRMRSQEAALWGGVGLFNTKGKVTRHDWQDYVKSLHLSKYLPGLQGYGYAEHIWHQDKTYRINRIRAEGFPDFKIYPPGKRETYSAIIYLEPFKDRNLRAFGYDMFSEPTRRAAMERARDTGKAAVSGKVTLVQETENDVQLGFLMYLPVYYNFMPINTVEEKRVALKGFVYSPFRIKDLMHGILGKGDSEIDFRIYDSKSREALLYDSASNYSEHLAFDDNQFVSSLHFPIGGRTWLLEFRSKPGFISPSEQNQPLLVAVGGILIDILLFLTISSLSSQRHQANKIAKQMTEELRAAKDFAEQGKINEMALRKQEQQTNKKLIRANEGLMNFNRIVAHDLRAPLKRVEAFVDILNQDYKNVLNVEGEDVLFRIDRSARKMRTMLDSLLEYSKYSEVVKNTEKVSVGKIVNSAIETLNIDKNIVKINFHNEENKGVFVQGNRDLLVLVMQNLLSNSIKFKGHEDLAIFVTSRYVFEKMFEIAVEDNGIGIAPQYAERVFKIFARLHNEEEYAGTGIGLAVCKRIISDHNGSIFVDTNFDNGTRVVIRLPLAA